MDLQQFDSVADALAKVEPGDRYVALGRPLIAEGGSLPVTLPAIFWFSMLTRSQSLHGAIAREAKQANPHAVLPLIRAFAECAVVVIYVMDHPGYVEVLTTRARELPNDGPKRKSIQALVRYASQHAPGMKDVYAELSEATHFGSTAMWASFSLDDEASSFSWASSPRWRDDDAALTAVALTLEIAEALSELLAAFAQRHLIPLLSRDTRA